MHAGILHSRERRPQCVLRDDKNIMKQRDSDRNDLPFSQSGI